MSNKRSALVDWGVDRQNWHSLGVKTILTLYLPPETGTANLPVECDSAAGETATVKAFEMGKAGGVLCLPFWKLLLTFSFFLQLFSFFLGV